MNDRMQWKNLLVAFVGATVGGVVGHYAACWLVRQGFYALVLPGAALGWGAGFLVKDRSVVRGVVCGVAALVLGLFTDWRIEPFIADDGLGYYFSHLQQLRPITLVMVAAGGVCGGWMALGREQPALSPAPGPQPPGAGAA